jgi:hypothetical protein
MNTYYATVICLLILIQHINSCAVVIPRITPTPTGGNTRFARDVDDHRK